MNIADLRCRLRGAPTLAHWLSDEALSELLRWPSASTALDQSLMAQAAWRARVNEDWRRSLQPRAWHEPGILDALEQWLRDPQQDFDATPFGAIHELRRWNADWERADGAILIAMLGVPGLEAAALPFELEEREPEGPRVIDAEGRPLNELSRPLDGLPAELLRADLRARLRWLPEQGFPVEGRSASLALALAFNARFKLPRGIMASVAIEDGSIAPVAEPRLKLAAARRAAAKLLILPEGSGLGSQSPSILEMPLGERASEAISMLYRSFAAQGLASPCLNELERSVQRAERDLRASRRPPRKVLQDLQGIEAALEQLEGLKREDLLFELSIQKMAALCHCGESAQALAMLEALEDRAAALGGFERLARAQAFAVVSLTDLGFFPAAIALARSALATNSRVETSLLSRRRSEMELRGSLGQALCFAALLPRFSAEDARRELEAALACARELQSPEDVARDANYLVLWAALHCPEELLERSSMARQEAERDPISEQFLRRIQGLAAYMAALQGRALPWDRVLPDQGPTWLRATSLKYRAALAAADESYDFALKDFSDAFSILSRESSPILRFIQATIAVEAWVSLRQRLASISRQWRNDALRVFDSIEARLPGTLVAKWRAFLEGGADPRLEFPY